MSMYTGNRAERRMCQSRHLSSEREGDQLFSLVAIKQSVRVENGSGSTKDTFSSSGCEEKRGQERSERRRERRGEEEKGRAIWRGEKRRGSERRE
jgi:hypothetical protein